LDEDSVDTREIMYVGTCPLKPKIPLKKTPLNTPTPYKTPEHKPPEHKTPETTINNVDASADDFGDMPELKDCNDHSSSSSKR
jgi:hypothetical protein